MLSRGHTSNSSRPLSGHGARSLVTWLIGLNLVIHGLDGLLVSWGYGVEQVVPVTIREPAQAEPSIVDEDDAPPPPAQDAQDEATAEQPVVDGDEPATGDDPDEAHDSVVDVTITHQPLRYYGEFSAATAVQRLELWRLITFQFLHAHLPHLVFNMLALYFFGPLVESFWGPRRFMVFYLLCGVAGAAAYLGLWAAGLIVTDAATPMVGASAGIFGILIAGAVIAPNIRVMLLFPPIPMKLRTLALVAVGIGIYTVLWRGDQPGSNAGGEAAHLGGAALGYLLIRHPQWLGLKNRFIPR